VKTQTHHKIPRCRGGTDDPSNLVELTLYEHALIHALDFLEGGVEFDCRNPFWAVLQIEEPDLSSKVLQEKARRMSVKMKKANSGVPKSPEHREKLAQNLKNIANSRRGKPGRKLSDEELTSFRGSIKNQKRFRCTVTGFETTGGALTGYQKARGIDPSNRIQITNNV